MTMTIKKTRIWLMIAILFVAILAAFVSQASIVNASNNGLAQRPYMG
jgi:hypothetical protein